MPTVNYYLLSIIYYLLSVICYLLSVIYFSVYSPRAAEDVVDDVADVSNRDMSVAIHVASGQIQA